MVAVLESPYGLANYVPAVKIPNTDSLAISFLAILGLFRVYLVAAAVAALWNDVCPKSFESKLYSDFRLGWCGHNAIE